MTADKIDKELVLPKVRGSIEQSIGLIAKVRLVIGEIAFVGTNGRIAILHQFQGTHDYRKVVADSLSTFFDKFQFYVKEVLSYSLSDKAILYQKFSR